MKRTSVCLILMFATLVSFGQSKSSRNEIHEKIQSMKIAYLTDKLQLKPEEAQKFWPVFNEYDTQRHDLEKAIFKSNYVDADSLNKLTEKQISVMVTNRLDMEQRLINLRINYYQKFEKILPENKVYLLFEAEAGFKKMLLEHLQEIRNTGKDNDPSDDDK